MSLFVALSLLITVLLIDCILGDLLYSNKWLLESCFTLLDIEHEPEEGSGLIDCV